MQPLASKLHLFLFPETKQFAFTCNELPIINIQRTRHCKFRYDNCNCLQFLLALSIYIRETLRKMYRPICEHLYRHEILMRWFARSDKANSIKSLKRRILNACHLRNTSQSHASSIRCKSYMYINIFFINILYKYTVHTLCNYNAMKITSQLFI